MSASRCRSPARWTRWSTTGRRPSAPTGGCSTRLRVTRCTGTVGSRIAAARRRSVPGESDLQVVQVVRGETGLRIREVEVPHPDEGLVEAEPDHLGQPVVEGVPPLLQGRHVAVAKPAGLLDPQPGVFGDDLVDRGL